MIRSRVKVSLLLLTLVTASCAEKGDVEEFDESAASDNATLRRQAMNEWYNEAQNTIGGHETSWSPEYRKFILEAAARERAKWAYMLPGSEGAKPFVIAGLSWTNVGPTKADFIKNGSSNLQKSDSGRPRSIVVDPNDAKRIYLATAGGGVWRTLDGGASWTPLTETLGSLACGSLAMDPSNSSVLYLGLGDPFDGTGIGLVKTTDGGATWSAPVYLGDSSITTQVMVAQAPNNNVILAATNKGLFRSTDSGATWAAVSLATGIAATPYAWSLAWTGGTGYALAVEANPDAASGTTSGQVFTSSDNGATWTKATGPTKSTGVGRITLASAPSNRLTLYAMAAIPNSSSSTDLADIFKSTNGGTSWTALSVTKKRYSNGNTESRSVNTLLNGQGWYNGAVVVNPTNPNMAFFGGALLLARTSDGGSSYTQVSNWLAQFSLPYVHADFHAATYAGSTLYVGTDGGLFKSTDNGASFTPLNEGITTHLAYSVGSSPANPDAVITGLQDNGTRVRAGITSTFNQTIGGDGFGSDVNQQDAKQMLGSLYYDRIYKSIDSGQTWVSASGGITESNNSSTAPFITRVNRATYDATGNTLYTYSLAKVYKTTNYAGTWTALGATGFPADQYIRNVSVAHAGPTWVGVVSSGGRVFVSSNGGTSWAQTAALPNNGLSMSYIHFDTVNPNTVYVASVAPDQTKNHLWRSSDFGSSWTAIDTAPGFPFGVPVNVIRQDPTDGLLYAATELGVYASTDNGGSWTRLGAGMPLVNVTDLYVSATGGLVRASTFGRGIWQLN